MNGQSRTVTTDPQRPLLQVLREDLKLTGPKGGCGEGRCGACTVLIDGKRQHSCLLPMKEAAGKAITTMAAIDRLVHHAIILEFNGESMRVPRDKEKDKGGG